MKPHLNKINEISGDDDSFKKKMISILKKEFPKEEKEYFKLVEDEKYIETAEIVHKLKHKINLLGFIKGYEITKNYEKDLRNKTSISNHEFNQLLGLINNFLKTI